MIQPIWLLWGIVLPVAISAAVLLAAAGPWGGSRGRWTQVAGIIGLALAMGTGIWSVEGLPGWPPASAMHRFLCFVLPAIVIIELLATCSRKLRPLIWGLRAALVIALPRVLLHGSVYLVEQPFSEDRLWTWPQELAWLMGIAAVTLAAWLSLSVLQRRGAVIATRLILVVMATGTGLVIATNNAQSTGQMAFSLAAALVALTLASLLLPRGIDALAVGLAIISLAALLITALFFAPEFRLSDALLLMLAPVAALLADIPWIHRRRPFLVGVIRVALVAIIVGIAVIPSLIRFVPTIASELGYGSNEPSPYGAY